VLAITRSDGTYTGSRTIVFIVDHSNKLCWYLLMGNSSGGSTIFFSLSGDSGCGDCSVPIDILLTRIDASIVLLSFNGDVIAEDSETFVEELFDSLASRSYLDDNSSDSFRFITRSNPNKYYYYNSCSSNVCFMCYTQVSEICV
jgi:hypothetical protein